MSTFSPTTPDTGQGTKSQAADDVNKATETVKQDLSSAADAVRSDIDDLTAEAQNRAGEVAEQAKSFAGEQKDVAAGHVDGIASAIDKVAKELEGTDQAAFAGYARDLAGGLHRVSDTVKTRNVDEIIGMAEDFGRRQPIAFLGAAALAGFVASRFALASAQRRTDTSADRTGNGTSYSAGTAHGAKGTNYSGTTGAKPPTLGQPASSADPSTSSTYGSRLGGTN